MKYKALYEKTLEIGQKKLAEGDLTGRVQGPRIGTGGGFSGIFLWDTAFCIFWMRYHQDLFPCTRSLDNFYRLQEEDGCIHREYDAEGNPIWPKDHPITFAPPLLAWAELGLHEVNQDRDRLKTVYPFLKRHYQWCQANWQKDNGLYFGDCLGTGMDNLPRYPIGFTGSDQAIPLDYDRVAPHVREGAKGFHGGQINAQWNRQGTFIDMSSQVAFNGKNLAKIAQLIGHEDEAHWTAEHDRLKALIHEKCWSGEHGFYFDLDDKDQPIIRYHIGGFWPLLAEIVPEDCLDAYLSHLRDERKFNRPFPVPSLSADDPDYDAGGNYWVGSSWPCTTYMVLKGLTAYGQDELAFEIAEQYVRVLDQVYRETDTIWENNSPERIECGSNSGPNFCGWGGLGPVAVVREFLDGHSSCDSCHSNDAS